MKEEGKLSAGSATALGLAISDGYACCGQIMRQIDCMLLRFGGSNNHDLQHSKILRTGMHIIEVGGEVDGISIGRHPAPRTDDWYLGAGSH